MSPQRFSVMKMGSELLHSDRLHTFEKIYAFNHVEGLKPVMIGERLLDLRKDAGLTQDELGAILKINKHSISSYERDKSEPPDDLKILIAQYFHVSVDYLLGLTDTQASYPPAQKIVYLPRDFPETARGDLKDYIDFLMYRQKNRRQ